MHTIFVYGTLLFPGIVGKLTGKSFSTSPAVLPGYKRFCVKDCDYPAIISVERSKTYGLLIENIDDMSFRIISFYEGDKYEKKIVTVLADGKPVEVLAFVWAKNSDLLEDKEWDANHFQHKLLEHYLNGVVPETLEEFGKK